MKEIHIRILFEDEDYAELEQLAEELDCSVVEIICEFVRDGLADRSWVDYRKWELEKIKETRKRLVKRFCD